MIHTLKTYLYIFICPIPNFPTVVASTGMDFTSGKVGKDCEWTLQMFNSVDQEMQSISGDIWTEWTLSC